jgi:hypothetical protein
MICAIRDMWFHNIGHLIPEASSVDCSLHGFGKFEEVLSVIILKKQTSVSLK